MISINDYLNTILGDFKTYVDSQNELCKLLEVHFDAGRIPDYSDLHVQQLYLLRYAYAYAFEYKYMYKRLMERIGDAQEISVVSVGCGNLLDYWSLVHVVKEKYNIIYNGIDAIDWSYRFEARPRDDVGRVIGNAVSYFQGKNRLSSNVYIFPKSISEFSLNEVSTIAKCFTRETVSPQKIHFMFSLRTDAGSIERDMNKTGELYRTLLNNGFRSTDKSNNRSEFIDEIKGQYIRNVDDDFQHPGNVIDYLKDLSEKCNTIKNCPNRRKCENRLCRWPILKCQYASWQIFTFEK